MIRIRTATANDLTAIQKLNHELFVSDNRFYGDLNTNWPHEDAGLDYFTRSIAEADRYINFVAVDDKHGIVGYLNGFIHKPNPAMQGVRSEISNMCVSQEFRSQNIGSLLINEFKTWSKQKGVDIMLVTAFAANQGAVGFYQKNGFQPYELTQWQKLSND